MNNAMRVVPVAEVLAERRHWRCQLHEAATFAGRWALLAGFFAGLLFASLEIGHDIANIAGLA